MSISRSSRAAVLLLLSGLNGLFQHSHGDSNLSHATECQSDSKTSEWSSSSKIYSRRCGSAKATRAVDRNLYISHHIQSLDANKTSRRMYVYPLLKMLDEGFQSAYTQMQSLPQPAIFPRYPNVKLVLLVDIKTSGPETLRQLQEQLQPPMKKVYISLYDGEDRFDRVLTIVATGDAAFDSILSNTFHCDILSEVPLQSIRQLLRSSVVHGDEKTFTTDYGNATADGPKPAFVQSELLDSTNSFYASILFRSAVGTSSVAICHSGSDPWSKKQRVESTELGQKPHSTCLDVIASISLVRERCRQSREVKLAIM